MSNREQLQNITLKAGLTENDYLYNYKLIRQKDYCFIDIKSEESPLKTSIRASGLKICKKSLLTRSKKGLLGKRYR